MRNGLNETSVDLGREPPNAAAVDGELSALRGQRVAVALSGGVDSAVAALRLVEHGAEVVGLALRLHDPDPDNPLAPRACCPPDDLQDARRVAEILDFPFYAVDARESFNTKVVRPFVQSYLTGRTPNPCVGCNAFVKLERLHQRALALGCHRLATGHFTRVSRDKDGAPRLFAGEDKSKDQSYFLFSTPSSILKDLVFPVGAWTKAQVREVAVSSGLPVAHKLESQEVCFVGGAGAGGFVMRQPEAAGNHQGAIVSETGQTLGQHQGVMNYTVGQRRGLGIAAPHPLHVLSIDAGTKTVTVGPAQSLMRSGLIAKDVNWPNGCPSEPVRALIRIRYRDRGTLGWVYPLEDTRVRVQFDEPVRSVTPGQATVFYSGDEVLGGGWIVEATE